MGISDYIPWGIILPAVLIPIAVIVIVFIFMRPIIKARLDMTKKMTDMTQNMTDMTKNMFNSQQNNTNNVNMDTANLSGNVVFYFDGHVYQTQVGFCNLRIDNQEPIKVFPSTPIGLVIDSGIHTIFVTYPRQGNEVYPAKTQFEAKPNTRYQIIYKFPITKFTPSQISINIISED